MYDMNRLDPSKRKIMDLIYQRLLENAVPLFGSITFNTHAGQVVNTDINIKERALIKN